MVGPGATGSRGEIPAAPNLSLDQGIGDLAAATEQYFRRLVDLLDYRILLLEGVESKTPAPLVRARAAAERGLLASMRLTERIAQDRK